MKIQTAIDRVSLERLLEIGNSIYGHTDIVEVGTSLIKDYGVSASVGAMRAHFPDMTILADIKTCDEGAYEFRIAFEAGADYATVMGFSSDATIRACMEVAAEFGKECFIDLLEVPDERLERLMELFPEAVFGIHLPSDLQGEGLTELVRDKCRLLKNVHAVAAAGGVKIGNLPFMKEAGVDIAIVGGAITKAEDIGAAAQAFTDAAK
ncbi:MAG: orotidine 5'-phosphate decarboxylase [Stomatobaculum sp.]|nr:orotidine 5'-phosphate decarboxylase [Stomatobaculum sp.]